MDGEKWDPSCLRMGSQDPRIVFLYASPLVQWIQGEPQEIEQLNIREEKRLLREALHDSQKRICHHDHHPTHPYLGVPPHRDDMRDPGRHEGLACALRVASADEDELDPRGAARREQATQDVHLQAVHLPRVILEGEARRHAVPRVVQRATPQGHQPCIFR